MNRVVIPARRTDLILSVLLAKKTLLVYAQGTLKMIFDFELEKKLFQIALRFL
jgi:hypothetical protein